MPIDQELLSVIQSIDDPEELNRFFMDICTPAELDDISLRWKTAQRSACRHDPKKDC
jgi:TrpR family trp operon transcriptional repressor